MVNARQTLGITHFLRIPLSTSASRPQIYKAHQQITTDPVAVGIPTEAFTPHSRLQINLGGLDLGTDDRYNTAIKHLHGLRLDNLYNKILQKKTLDLDASQSAQGRDGIFVDLHGLANYSGQIDLAACMALWAPVSDDLDALPLFCHVVKLSFFNAGLLRISPVLKTTDGTWVVIAMEVQCLFNLMPRR